MAVTVLAALATLAPRPASGQIPDESIELARSYTVRILGKGYDGTAISDFGQGSGFFITELGHVATNEHVVRGKSEFIVLYLSGRKAHWAPAEVVTRSEGHDLAILKTEFFPGARAAQLATHRLVDLQPVVAVGFPGVLFQRIDRFPWMSAPLPPYVTPVANFGTLEVHELLELIESMPWGRSDSKELDAGIAESNAAAAFSGAVGRLQEMVLANGPEVSVINHSAQIDRGNSGGPLVDRDGRVVGVNAAGITDTTTYPISVRIYHLVDLARAQPAHQVPVRVTTTPVSKPKFEHLSLVAAVGGLSVVAFLMAMRRPRSVVVRSLSRLSRKGGSRREDGAGARDGEKGEPWHGGKAGGGSREAMSLRGRDRGGRAFDLSFSPATFEGRGGRLSMGRHRELVDLYVPHDSVSRRHAVLSMRGGRVYVEDRNSGNGTRLNGREIALGREELLRHGDRLELGEVEFVFEAAG